jgi:hypothetical protein
MTTSETFIFGFFVIITVIVFATVPGYIRRERNVRNSNSDSSSDSLNGEDV